MPPELIAHLLKGAEYIAENCIHDKIVVTVDGVYLEQTKEFHPAGETPID